MPENNDYDFSKAPEAAPLVPEGWYEAVLEKASIRTSKNNPTSTYIHLEFKIRDDVEQGSKNSYVYDAIYHDKFKTDAYDLRKLRDLIYTQQKVKGFNPVFHGDDDVVQFLNGLYMKINVTKLAAKDGYPEKNAIAFGGYKPSEAMPKVLPSATTVTATAPTSKQDPGSIDVTDDDLPF